MPGEILPDANNEPSIEIEGLNDCLLYERESLNILIFKNDKLQQEDLLRCF